jgi:hypothetical protein
MASDISYSSFMPTRSNAESPYLRIRYINCLNFGRGYFACKICYSLIS